MSIRSDYFAGTVTVSAGGTVVTGVGTGWLAAEFQEGDIFIADGWRCNIASVDSNTQLTLDEEGGLRGGALSGAPYRLRYMSNGSRASGQARQLIDMLGTSGNIQALGGLTGSSGTVPVFTGPGTMEIRPYASGLVPRGDWDIATVYTAGDLATFNGNVFASLLDDNVGNEPPSSQTTDSNWMYVPVAPGPEGPQGPQGATGPANSLSIGTVVGGDTADATITGTAPSQTLNLTLPKGDTGGAGWTPVFAVVADGARYVQQVVDWVGGTGTKPATGEYVGPSGFVTAIGDAVNIRGASGSGTGDVVGPSSSTDGRMALFDGATGKLLKEGAAPFSGSYDDLTDKPTLGSAAATDATDYATAAQGAAADTAVQPSDLADVATSGNYDDLSNKPTLGTMAAETASDYTKTSGLGGAALLDVGTTAGTVAAGDDSRFNGNAKLAVEDQSLTGGARVTSKSLGTVSSGTLTPDPGDRPLQHYTNGGAHTLAPGSNTGSYLLDITNNSSAGAITTSGWTKVSGDAFTTTNGHKFRCHCSVGNGGSLLIIQALQ